MRYLVAIDFSGPSVAALDTARALAAKSQGMVTLAHVRAASDIRAAVAEELTSALKLKSPALKDVLAAHYAARLAAIGKPGETVVILKGRAATELAKAARKGHDVLVMGTRGRGGVTAALLGSTVQELLSISPIPVLVVGEGAARSR
ncbi:MAG: universal stress protein [Acidobacteriota bacterium]